MENTIWEVEPAAETGCRGLDASWVELTNSLFEMLGQIIDVNQEGVTVRKPMVTTDMIKRCLPQIGVFNKLDMVVGEKLIYHKDTEVIQFMASHEMTRTVAFFSMDQATNVAIRVLSLSNSQSMEFADKLEAETQAIIGETDG